MDGAVSVRFNCLWRASMGGVVDALVHGGLACAVAVVHVLKDAGVVVWLPAT